ncbi:unnamed protein product [Prunus brigantina]
MTTQISSAEVTNELETAEADWRYPIVRYLRDPSGNHERTTRFRARCYLIYQNELYRKGSDGLLLLCPSAKDIKVIMTESHNGICGAHQSGIKMTWLIRRHGYYWPTILKNCIEYAKGCIKCQIYGPIQRVPAKALHPVTKPWPFRGWAVDIICKIYPFASNQHALILSNGQAEASNKVIKGILEKMIEEKPRAWHDLLPEALWAYRVSKRSATGTSPYALTYGHDAIVPIELKAQKMIAARAYNRKVKQKTFTEGDLVWRAVLPIGTKNPRFGKF